MDDKKMTTPLSEEELKSVAAGGGAEQDPSQVRIGGCRGDYKCYVCGFNDFRILQAQGNRLLVQCKNCGTQSWINEN